MEKINGIIVEIPIMLIKLYRLFISPILGSNCRYIPSCSEYAIESLRNHGLLKGSYMSLKRILSCRPGGGHGYDPVPKGKNKQ